MTTTVTGAGYAADSLVTVTSEGMTLGTASTDETGSFRMVIAAPSSVAGGYEITAADEAGTSRNVTLTVPDLTGPTGVDGDDGARGEVMMELGEKLDQWGMPVLTALMEIKEPRVQREKMLL